MAMAHAAPQVGRDFRFHISVHAVERFRERGESEYRSRTDRDLAILLDDRIHQAIANNQFTDVIDRDAPDVDTKIVAVEKRSGSFLHVVMRVVKPNSYPPMRTVGGPAGAALGAVTVLTQEMAAQNYEGKHWVVKPKPLRTSIADKLATAIASAKPAAPAPAAPPPAEEKRASNALGGTRKERADFIASIFHLNPDASRQVVSAKVEEKFGTGISNALYERVRAEVMVGTYKPHVEATGNATLSAEPPKATSNAAEIALQFAQAVEAEKAAKTRVASAERELAAAQQILQGASAQVTALLEQLQAQRA